MASNDRSSYQPTSPGGITAAVKRLLVGTPTYRGTGQPEPQAHGIGGLLGALFGVTPAYKTAAERPMEPLEPPCCDAVPDPIAEGCDDGPLTIVIARD